MQEQESLRPITASQIAMTMEAVEQYQAARSEVDGYLASRGIAEETADTFRLGFVDDPFPGHERMAGYLAIPYLGYNRHGVEEAWSIRFRCVPELSHPGQTCKALKHGKYQGVSGEHARMFNVRAIRDAGDEIHLAEGELDAIILNQAGFPAVAMPGASQWRYHHTRMLAGFNQVYVWADPDESGSKLLNEVMRTMRNAAPVRLEADVNDTFMQGGYAALDAAVEAVRWE